MKEALPILLAVGGAIFLLAGCAPGGQAAGPAQFTPETVTPDARISLGEDQAIDIAVGFVNETDRAVSQMDDFEGRWMLVSADGATRAAGRVLVAGPLEPREAAYPLVYTVRLDSGDYILRWGAPAIGTVTVEFTVIDDGAGIGVGRKVIFDKFIIGQPAPAEGQMAQ